MTCCIAHLVDGNLRITVMSNIVLCSIVEGHKTREKPDGIACNLCRFVLFRFICFLVSGNVQVYHPPCLNQYIIQYPISHPLIQITFVRKWIITTSEQFSLLITVKGEFFFLKKKRQEKPCLTNNLNQTHFIHINECIRIKNHTKSRKKSWIS